MQVDALWFLQVSLGGSHRLKVASRSFHVHGLINMVLVISAKL